MSDNDKRYKPCTVTCECVRTLPAEEEGENFRYLLKKEWKGGVEKKGWKNNPLIIIGCNPSTANEERLDRTMRLIERFIKTKKYCGYIMLNLYPQIAGRVGLLVENNSSCIDCIQKINKKIIKNTLKENKSSDILFAFGRLIEERDYLYNPCYKDITEIINENIKDNINYSKKLKRLSLNGNEFDYPLHFGYRRINYGVIDGGQLNLVEFKFEEFNENLDNKIQSKKANNPLT